jgi:hypothetical protein
MSLLPVGESMKELKVRELIAESYNAAEADCALAFIPDDHAQQQLLDAGKAVLQGFPRQVGACALMTAMWVAFIRANTPYPIHAIAGALLIDGRPIFGRNACARDVKRAFTGTNLDWDGHCWIIFGNLIGDLSICRTAYSRESPPLLNQRIVSAFGKGRGLLAAPADAFLQAGMRYEPYYVITDNEITGLFQGALSIMEKQRAESIKRPNESNS